MNSIIEEYNFSYDCNYQKFFQFNTLKNFKDGFCYELIKEIYDEKKIKENYSIAYGYLKDSTNYVMRHCFIIDKNDNVIDPILLKHQNLRYNELKYYIIKKFKPEEYGNFLLENKNKRIDLKNELFNDEKNVIKNIILKNNYRINSHDYNSYIKDILQDMRFDTSYLDETIKRSKTNPSIMYIDIEKKREFPRYREVIDYIVSKRMEHRD